jgi:hypothetical protein
VPSYRNIAPLSHAPPGSGSAQKCRRTHWRQ